MSKFDLILQRTTSISQIILVAIAVFTIRYSVIPLYQKELASEQLAKIQIDQMAAEERLESLKTGYSSQLQEIELARAEILDLTAKLNNDRAQLNDLTTQIDKKNIQLAHLNTTLNKEKNRALAASTQLVESQKLKFIQALEWYTLIAPLDDKCRAAMRKWTRPDTPEYEKLKKPGCDPYENIKNAILKIQSPTAKDASGDELQIEPVNLERWSKHADSLMEQNRFQLSDKMDYAHRDQLVREAEDESAANLSPSELNRESKRSLEAAMALITYESEIKKQNREVVSWYIKLLRKTI